jgi:hypothetical protein
LSVSCFQGVSGRKRSQGTKGTEVVFGEKFAIVPYLAPKTTSVPVRLRSVNGYLGTDRNVCPPNALSLNCLPRRESPPEGGTTNPLATAKSVSILPRFVSRWQEFHTCGN